MDALNILVYSVILYLIVVLAGDQKGPQKIFKKKLFKGFCLDQLTELHIRSSAMETKQKCNLGLLQLFRA